MLQHTLRKLTIINSFVFLLIFAAFASILYGYLSYRLFDKIDEAMQLHALSFRLSNGNFAPVGQPIFDPRIFLLLCSTDGRTIDPSPFRTEEEIRNIAKVASSVEAGEIQTKEYEGHSYRMIRWPYRYQDNFYNAGSDFQVQEIIVVSIVDSEVQLLENFLWIILSGSMLSIICIVLAGYVLAKRAMIPIQKTWEKQQQFVSNASHELRSPITGIYSNAELMLRHPNSSIKDESYRINTIMKESKRMTKLITSLLTLARADADKAELQLAPVNLSEIISSIVEHFNQTEEFSNIRITVNVMPDLELIADEERLHQLIVILLDNAVKYTPAGGQVLISCWQSNKNVIISVQDTGIGISSEDLPCIFDRFFRGDKSRSRESGGTGLGLAIAKWIVEKHEGKIGVKSELGKGAEFTVSIPVTRKKES